MKLAIALGLALSAGGCAKGLIGDSPESDGVPFGDSDTGGSNTGDSGVGNPDVDTVDGGPRPVADRVFVTRSGQSVSDCMRPCAVQFDAQAGEELSWDGGDGYGGVRGVAESEFVWDFDDGGSGSDADGYLAAKVYETAGAFRPFVVVNGEAWNAQTIEVVDPEWVGCVSPTSSFADCPTTNRYTAIADALAAAGNQKRHVLLHRGEFHGAMPQSTDDTQTMIGAYGTGPKPRVEAYYFPLASTWRLVDLDMAPVVNDEGSEDTVVRPSSPGGLMLRIEGRGDPTPMWMEMRNPVFVIDTVINTGSDYVLMSFDGTQWGVVQGSTFESSGRLHVTRVDGDSQRKWLFKNSTFNHDGNGVSGLRLSGTSEWIVVQGCTLGDILSMQDSGPNDMSIQRYVIVERNILNRNEYQGPWANVGSQFTGFNHVIRNNVAFHDSGSDVTDFSAGDLPATGPRDMWFINNTSINNNTAGLVLSRCPTCVAVNNIVYTTVSELDGSGCIASTSGVMLQNNWCYSVNGTCLDPADGDSDCHDPGFMSLTLGDTDFARPAAASVGVNNGSSVAPLWKDLNGDPRGGNIDVGAVEQ